MVRTMLWASLALIASLAPLASADIEFTSPKPGEKIKGDTTIMVKWKDSGDKPALDDLTTYELFLCAGGNEPVTFIQLATLTRQATPFTTSGNEFSTPVNVGLGASKPENAYFFMMRSTASKGGTVTNYSPRFSLTGMTGVFPADITKSLEDIDGTDGPARIDETSDGTPADPAGGDYDVEYTMQTGPTRYAPMQPIPPTKITKKDAKPLHPTSAFTIATTFLPPPKVHQTTITQSQTYSVKSRENTAAPAAMPSDDMEKFLRRWKD